MNEAQRKLTSEINAVVKSLKRERDLNRLIAAYAEIEKKAGQAKVLAGNPDTTYHG